MPAINKINSKNFRKYGPFPHSYQRKRAVRLEFPELNKA